MAAMRDRIWAMRRSFVAGLKAEGVQRDFSFIERQHGMFSFTGLTKDQVKRCATSTRSTSWIRAASTWRA